MQNYGRAAGLVPSAGARCASHREGHLGPPLPGSRRPAAGLTRLAPCRLKSLSGPQFPCLSAGGLAVPSVLSSAGRGSAVRARLPVSPAEMSGLGRQGSPGHSCSLAPSHQSPSFPEAALFPVGPSDSSIPPASPLGRTSHLRVRVIRGPPQLPFREGCWPRTFVEGDSQAIPTLSGPLRERNCRAQPLLLCSPATNSKTG